MGEPFWRGGLVRGGHFLMCRGFEGSNTFEVAFCRSSKRFRFFVLIKLLCPLLYSIYYDRGMFVSEFES